eukprot:gene666-biopygen9903
MPRVEHRGTPRIVSGLLASSVDCLTREGSDGGRQSAKGNCNRGLRDVRGTGRGRPGAARERAAAPPRGRARIPRSVYVRSFVRHARHLHRRGQRAARRCAALNPVPRARNPVPRGRNPVPRGRNPVPRGRNPVPRGRNSVPRGRNPVPRGRNPVPRGRNPVPRARNPVPRGRNPVPRGRNSVPRARNPVPRARNPVPRARNSVPRARNSVPRARNSVPRARNWSRPRLCKWGA